MLYTIFVFLILSHFLSDSLASKIENLLNSKVVCLWHDESKNLIFALHWSIKETSDEQNVRIIFKEHLHNFELPDQITYIKEFPMSMHGKLDRRKLLRNILDIRKLSEKSPLIIFQNFLEDVLGFGNDLISTKGHMTSDEQKIKRIRHNIDISFTSAGGTSFQALSLSMEIGEILEQPEQQRQLLEMLLSPEVSIKCVMGFLTHLPSPTVQSNELNCQTFNTDNTYSIKLLWRADLKKCIDSSPSLFQEKVLTVGSHSHLLLTLDAQTGEEISKIELSDRIECTVEFVSPHLAIVGCYDGFLYGFNFQTGSIMWKINVNGLIKAKPILMDNLIIVSSYAEDFNVCAYDLKVTTKINVIH